MTVRLNSGAVEWREVDGEVVVLDLARSKYLAVNESGSALWALLAAGATRDALVARLRDGFGLAPERAAADVDAFLADLAGRGLLAED